ncbi:MAG: RNA methyltransferase [Candidatus Spechtbacterales bacterium]
MIVVLDNIRSMHNVGSIFRTADAAGIEKIYLCGITPSPLNEFKKPRQQITKVSLGAENSVKWEKYPASFKVLDILKKRGYKIFAVEQHKNSIPYYKVKLARKQKDKTVLILGHEIKGLSPAVLKRADKVLEIPMAGQKESLNVSVAFGIVVYGLIYN